MNEFAARFQKMWNVLRAGPAQVMRSFDIPQERVHESGEFAPKFVPGKQYLSVIVNEIFATQARRWFDLYDPAAFVMTEFTYDGKQISVPFVVGPAMLKDKAAITPNGISITDTRVAGLHPYAGGNFAITMILAEVKRESYAKNLLDLVGSVSSAFPVGAALSSHLKIADTLLTGVETLLGLPDTRPLAAHRFEYNSGHTPWLKPGFSALIALDESEIRQKDFSVMKGRLRDGTAPDAPSFKRADFILYSLCTEETRTDIGELPFYPRFKTALREAADPTEGAWERAKAALVTIYQEALTSPDLTWDQAHQIIEEFKTKLLAAKRTREAFAVLSSKEFENDISSPRDREMREVHKLLDLA